MSTLEKEPYRDFDLLSPLRGKEEETYIQGNGAVYVTKEGREVVDFNEMLVVLGQNNRPFQQAMEEAIGGITSSRGNLETKQELLHYLDRTTKGRFRAAHLTSSGSEAVESAIRIAQKLTGRREIISFWNSIHGRTFLSSSISGVAKRKAGYGPLAAGTVFFPYPYCAQCPFGKEKENCGFACLNVAKKIYEDASAQDAAALIVEPCQGNGVILPPKGYLKQLENWAKEKGILLIVDEIQSGMGRSGQMYCYEEEGLDPDMLLLGKAMGNGLHIAALLTKQVPSKEDLLVYAGGAGDDPIACRAACEVFRQLENGLLDHVAEAGMVLQEGLEKATDFPFVKECRGRGLLAAVEFVSSDICQEVHRRLWEEGFLLGRMKNILFCKAPYVVTKQQVKKLIFDMNIILQKMAREIR